MSGTLSELPGTSCLHLGFEHSWLYVFSLNPTITFRSEGKKTHSWSSLLCFNSSWTRSRFNVSDIRAYEHWRLFLSLLWDSDWFWCSCPAGLIQRCERFQLNSRSTWKPNNLGSDDIRLSAGPRVIFYLTQHFNTYSHALMPPNQNSGNVFIWLEIQNNTTVMCHPITQGLSLMKVKYDQLILMMRPDDCRTRSYLWLVSLWHQPITA